MLDQYTRGKVERQIVDFDKEIKAGREKKPKKGKKERQRWRNTLASAFPLTTAKEESNYDLEEGESSSESSTDTTDIDEVCMCDILYCILIIPAVLTLHAGWRH